jgi:hypothetical protein
MHAVASVDGFIADDRDDVGPLFEWYFNGEAAIVDGGPFKVSEASITVAPMWERIGATVIGRHLFDLTNGWEGTPPAGGGHTPSAVPGSSLTAASDQENRSASQARRRPSALLRTVVRASKPCWRSDAFGPGHPSGELSTIASRWRWS